MATAYEPSSASARQNNSQTVLNLGGTGEHSPGGALTAVAEGPLLPLAVTDQRERRREARHPTNHAAVLTEINPLTFGTINVRLIDVSQHGLKVYLSRLLYRGAMVHVRVGKLVVVAEVRHCVRFAGGYTAGMAILDVFPCHGAAFSNVFSNCMGPDAS